MGYVEGTLIDLDKTPPELGQERRYISSAIVKRMDQNTVSSKKGTLYVLEGGLPIQDLENERVQANQLPHFILDRFSQGFPENWEKLKRHWVQFIESNKTNIENIDEAGEEEEEGEDRIGKAIAGKDTESRMLTKQCQVLIS